MLVLSRRINEELLFPNVGVRIKVLRNVGNRVQLGIEAPQYIEITRGERQEQTEFALPEGVSRHELQNELNAVRLAMTLYERQMDRGEVDAANQTFLRMVSQLRSTDLKWAPIEAPAKPPEAAGPKVLVVDDDANELQLMAGLLQMDGCQVKTASDGLEAIDVLKSSTTPDVVLLDMQMPRLNGKDTLTAIRSHELWSRLLVFGISGSAPQEYGITIGGQQGIDEWFEKPINPSELVVRMRHRLQLAGTVSA